MGLGILGAIPIVGGLVKLGKSAKALVKIGSKVFSKVLNFGKKVIGKVKKAVKAASGALNKMLTKAKKAATDLAKAIKDAAEAIAKKASNRIRKTAGKKIDVFQKRIDDLRSKMPNSKLKKEGNMATADVKIKGIKSEFNAHSRINKPTDKGADVTDFSHIKPESERIFKTYVNDGKPGAEYPRFHDTEAKILEDIASRVKDPNVSGTINLYTELSPCKSCSNIITEFRSMFPNIKLNIFTGQ